MIFQCIDPDYILCTVQTTKIHIVETSPNTYPSWVQIFVSVPLPCMPPLMSETMFHNHIAQLAIIMFLNVLIFKENLHVRKTMYLLTTNICLFNKYAGISHVALFVNVSCSGHNIDYNFNAS
jgi:hypothetical protein